MEDNMYFIMKSHKSCQKIHSNRTAYIQKDKKSARNCIFLKVKNDCSKAIIVI